MTVVVFGENRRFQTLQLDGVAADGIDLLPHGFGHFLQGREGHGDLA